MKVNMNFKSKVGKSIIKIIKHMTKPKIEKSMTEPKYFLIIKESLTNI